LSTFAPTVSVTPAATTLPPVRSLLGTIGRLSAPAVLENLLGSALMLIDTIMLAQLPRNSMYLAATGLAGIWLWRLANITGVTQVGASAYVSRRWGEGRYEEASRALTHMTLFGAGVGLLAALILAPLVPLIIGIYIGPSETATLSMRYMWIILPMFPGQIAFFHLASSMRAAGDTRTPLLLAAAMMFVNIFLNWVLIFGKFGLPAMKLDGAALATTISTYIALAAALVVIGRGVRPRRLFHANEGQPLNLGVDADLGPDALQIAAPPPADSGILRLRRDGWRPWVPGITPSVLKVAWPTFWEEILISIGFLAYFRMVAAFGETGLAAHAVCVRIEAFSFTAGWGIAVATSAMIGQALGARRPDLARRLFSLNTTVTMTLMGIAGLIMVLFPEALLGLFRPEPAVMELGILLMIVVAVEQSFIGSTMTLAGGLRGAGDTFPPFVVQLLGTIVTRIGAAYFFGWTLGMGLVGVYLGTVVDWVLRTAVLAWFVRRGRWATIQV